MSIPEVFFRETIDVGRYSNAVSNKFVENYVQVIFDAAEQLVKIDLRQQAAPAGVVIAPQTKKRLRAIIAQSKASMDRWSKDTTKMMIKEMEGLAKFQTGFIEGELQKAVKSGNIPINSVAVSRRYATSFVKTDPTKINIFTSKEFTEDDFIKFGSGKFELTARQGAMMTLPNGDTVQKAFRGIATRNQELLARTIRAGVFSGESTQQIARKLVGKLNFEDTAKAAGQTKLATHQIKTIVRTSVNQVQNQASQAVYAANSKVAPKYEYVATLDSKTSNICKRLDGRKFAYNKGPTPPQHFNCRSTTVPVVDYEGLSKRKGFEDLSQPPVGKVVSRPSATGRVPQGTQYGDWLLTQDKKLQIKTLGSEGKVNIFKKIAKREGSGHAALRKIIRNDGTEIPLEKLEKLYGKASVVKKVAKPKPVAAPKVRTPRVKDSPMFSTEGVDKFLSDNKFGNIQEFIEDSLDSMEGLEGLTGKHIKKMRLFMKKGNIVNQFNMKFERTKPLDQLKQRFLSGKNLKAFEESNKTVIKRFEAVAKRTSSDLSSDTREWKELWNGRGKLRIGSHKDLFERNIRLIKQGSATDESFNRKIKKYLFGNAKGDANGYTINNSAMVHTRLREGAKKINTASAKRIKKSAADTLDNNFKLSNLKGSAYERRLQAKELGLKSEIWSNSHPMDADIDWFSTFVHEMGHQVHFQAGGDNLGKQFMKLKGMTKPTEYSRKNSLEQFAESFVQYVFNPEGLQEKAPRLYNWVDQTLDQAIKNL